MGVRNLKAAGSSGGGSTLSDQLSVLEFIGLVISVSDYRLIFGICVLSWP